MTARPMRDAYLSSAGLALRHNRKERWSGQRAEAGRDPRSPQALSGVQDLPKGFQHHIGHVIRIPQDATQSLFARL